MNPRYKESLIIAAKGFGMGAADVVPGVSGGTMALILGIYQRWLTAIRSFDSVWLGHIFRLNWQGIFHYPHFAFLIPLAVGVLAALLFFTRIVPLPALLHSHPEPVYGLFFGLIVGSVIILLRHSGKPDGLGIFLIAVGIVTGWLIVNLVPMDTPDTPLFIFASGFIAISALMLPGVSGSFILLILHKYATVMNAVGHFQLSVLIPFGFGALAGFVIFSRVLIWLLERWHRAALLTINGILIGALWMIWPFQQREYTVVREKQRLISSTPQWPQDFDSGVLYALIMMLAGLVGVLWMERTGRRLAEV